MDQGATALYAESLPFPQPVRTRDTWRIPNPSYRHDRPTEIDRTFCDEIEWMLGKVSGQPIITNIRILTDGALVNAETLGNVERLAIRALVPCRIYSNSRRST
jgi:hypothetical protein